MTNCSAAQPQQPVILRGVSGTPVSFELRAVDEPMPPGGGLSIVAARRQGGEWQVLSVSEIADFTSAVHRMTTRDIAERHGGEFVLLAHIAETVVRTARRIDLIAAFDPPCDGIQSPPA